MHYVAHLHDTLYVVAPWGWLIVLWFLAMGFAAFVGFVLRRRTTWSVRRRMLTSASILPGLLILLSALGWLASSPGAEGWADLVDVLWLTVALVGSAIAAVGGLVGAGLAEWRARV